MEDEIIGYDGDEEVGFFRPGLFRLATRAGRTIAHKVQARSYAKMRTVAPAGHSLQGRIAASGQRQRMLPLGTVAIPIAGTGALSVVVQSPIQGNRLILESDAAIGEVTVTNVRVGTESQLDGVAAMPLEAFGNDTVGNELILSPARTGITLTVDLASTSAAIANVSGVLFGLSAG